MNQPSVFLPLPCLLCVCVCVFGCVSCVSYPVGFYQDIFIVMQLHSGGELFDRIVGRPRFTEDEVQQQQQQCLLFSHDALTFFLLG